MTITGSLANTRDLREKTVAVEMASDESEIYLHEDILF
jgi:hypothetical protein